MSRQRLEADSGEKQEVPSYVIQIFNVNFFHVKLVALGYY